MTRRHRKRNHRVTPADLNALRDRIARKRQRHESAAKDEIELRHLIHRALKQDIRARRQAGNQP